MNLTNNTDPEPPLADVESPENEPAVQQPAASLTSDEVNESAINAI